ncbi:helix-turn-helix domain-containing protein [Streptomyces sp. IBSBF 2435]|uniref:helix-turn-helix domain-containing protein n=1 Tax=Streptomyces sp. IBSBF 2435 TaxID=2903531 RepID=UPI002FDC4D1F
MSNRRFSGTRLRAARQAAGLTAGDVAARVHRSPFAVWSYERGRVRPPVDIASGLAEVIGVPLDDLLDEDRGAVA